MISSLRPCRRSLGDGSSRGIVARGFTLLEVMIALSILAVLATLVWSTFSPTMDAKNLAAEQADKYHGLRLAMGRMTREISMAFISDRYDARRYRERPTRFVASDSGSNDRLLFTTMAHERLYEDAKASDQAVVEYRLDRDPEDRDKKALIRREKTVIDEDLDDGGVEVVLASGIEGLDFEYWDPQEKEWEREWDTTRIERAGRLPERVRITLTAPGDDGKERKFVTQTVVFMQTPLGK